MFLGSTFYQDTVYKHVDEETHRAIDK